MAKKSARSKAPSTKTNPLSFRIDGDNAGGFRWYLVLPDGTLLAHSVYSLPTRQRARKAIAAVVEAVKSNPPILDSKD